LYAEKSDQNNGHFSGIDVSGYPSGLYLITVSDKLIRKQLKLIREN
jgi:hypothetical protein